MNKIRLGLDSLVSQPRTVWVDVSKTMINRLLLCTRSSLALLWPRCRQAAPSRWQRQRSQRRVLLSPWPQQPGTQLFSFRASPPRPRKYSLSGINTLRSADKNFLLYFVNNTSAVGTACGGQTDVCAYQTDVQHKTWDFQANILLLPRQVNRLYKEAAENLHPPKPQLFTY